MSAKERLASTAVVPPPWTLEGHGYLLLLRPLRSSGSPSTELRQLGGLGIVMILEYRRSPVGPYRELLYIPGYVSARVERGSERAVLRGHSIRQILVTTEASRTGGRANWAIPKEVGTIAWRSTEKSAAVVRLAAETGKALLRVDIGRRPFTELCPGGGPTVSTRLLPHTLLQVGDGAVYRTVIEGAARACLAGRARIRSYDESTAEIASRRVLLTLRVSRFRLRFPEATVERRASGRELRRDGS